MDLTPEQQEIVELKVALMHCRIELRKMRDGLRDAVAMLEVYYVPDGEGSAPTLDRCRALIGED